MSPKFNVVSFNLGGKKEEEEVDIIKYFSLNLKLYKKGVKLFKLKILNNLQRNSCIIL